MTGPATVPVGVATQPRVHRSSSNSSAVGRWSHTETALTPPSHVVSKTRKASAHDHVVGELVLHDHVEQLPRWALREPGADHVLERIEPRGERDTRDRGGRDRTPHDPKLANHHGRIAEPGRRRTPDRAALRAQ